MIRFFRVLLIICIALVFCMGAGLQAKPKLKNIIIISVDTLRADHLSCYGYPLNTSPAIDSLAADGVKFSHCYALTPLTAPSFTTMFTSLPPHKHGAKRNGLSVYRTIKTLPEYLKRYGYKTAAIISNWPLRKKLLGIHRGFDSFIEVFTNKRYMMGLTNPEGQSPRVNKKALAWLKKNRKRRFFLWIQYTDPHAPYETHKGFRFDYKKVPTSTYPPGTRMKRIKKYDSEIAFNDHQIGIILNKLKELGLYEDSLIIFHSDHGESFGEHNYFKHGKRLYNSTLHVPLIVKLPGNQIKNTVRHENVSLIDVSPTITSILNMRPIKHMEGLALFNNDQPLLNRKIVCETYGGTVLFRRKSKKYHLKVKPIRYAVIENSQKIIYNKKHKSYEAYQLNNDFFETKDIYRSDSSHLINLKQLIENYVTQISTFIKLTTKRRINEGALSKEDIDALRSLGYIE
jgi:arylsulfatase A-like enzyme